MATNQLPEEVKAAIKKVLDMYLADEKAHYETEGYNPDDEFADAPTASKDANKEHILHDLLVLKEHAGL